jgi:hypothetical protein
VSDLVAAAIDLVARTLPSSIRERHREEWMADATSAADHGVSRSSIVLGALALSLSLDRSLPEVSGFPQPELARRHAQWALAFGGLAVIVVQNRMLPFAGQLWLPLSLVLTMLIVHQLWAAARLSGGAGRASATFSSAALVAFAGASTIPIVVSVDIPGSRYLPNMAALCLLTGFVFGLIAWARPLGRGIIALLAATATLICSSAVLPVPALASPSLLLTLVVGVAALAVFLRERLNDPSAARRIRLVAGGLGGLSISGIAWALWLMLVAHPSAKSLGRSLDEIYAAIAETTRTAALAELLAVAGIAVLCNAAYVLTVFIASSRGRGSVRTAVAGGAALLASSILAIGSAGMTLTLALIDAYGSRASFSGDFTREVVSIAVVVAVIALIPPRSRSAAVSVSTSSPQR